MRYSLVRGYVVPTLLLLLASTPLMTAATADDIIVCALSAWSNDTDPRGLNIRAAPGSDAPVIGRIPVSGEMTITGFKAGWFRIDSAGLQDYDTGVTTAAFTGEGWVSGRRLGLLLNDADLHSAPAEASPIVAHLNGETRDGGLAGSDSFIVTRLLACQGDWVEVTGTFLDVPLSGWSIRTCANQVTTCP